MDSNSKRIGTFKEFLKERRKQKMLKENVSIEVDWWDECIAEVMQDLQKACGGYLSWETLVKFIKSKFAVLGRELPGYDDAIIIEHIKDLIFQYHADSMISNDNTQLHSQGVVTQELAQEILDKVREKTIPNAEAKNTAKIKLYDKEPSVLVPMKEVPAVQDEEDDAVDCLQYECRNVKTLDEYTSLLKEQVQTLKCEYFDGAVADCLKAIKDDAGSLKYSDVAQAAAWSDDELVDYVQSIVMQVIERISRQGKITAKGLDKKNARATQVFLKQAIGMLRNEITANVIQKIKSQGENEKVE